MKRLNLMVGCLVFLSLIGCGEKQIGSTYPDIEMLRKTAAAAYASDPNHTYLTNISPRWIRINQQYCSGGNHAYIKYDCLFSSVVKSNGNNFVGSMSGIMEFLKNEHDGHWVFTKNTITSIL